MNYFKRSCLYLFLSFCSFLADSASAQDSLFFDKEWKELESFEGAEYYQIIGTAREDRDRGVKRTFYRSGQVKAEEFFSSLENDTRSGVSRSWDREGRLKSVISYFKGERHGNLMTYWDNGQLKRKEEYIRGKPGKGTCWNAEGEEVAYFPYQVRPEFPGGMKALQEYIKENTGFPEGYVLKEKTRVVVKFVVDKEGKVTDIEVEDTADRVLVHSAYLAVRDMPAWSPGFLDGEAVNVYYSLPFVFQ